MKKLSYNLFSVCFGEPSSSVDVVKKVRADSISKRCIKADHIEDVEHQSQSESQLLPEIYVADNNKFNFRKW